MNFLNINNSMLSSIVATPQKTAPAANSAAESQPVSTLKQLKKKYPNIVFSRICTQGRTEPPISVIKGIDNWLSSIKDKPGFNLLKNIVLEQNGNTGNASANELIIGEKIFNKGEHIYSTVLNHEFEHLRDIDITARHLKEMLSTMKPAEIKDILAGKRRVLLHQHYEKILTTTSDRLKDDQKFKDFIVSLLQKSDDREVIIALRKLLDNGISKQSLGGAGFALFEKKEIQTIDKYLKMNYGIPSLYSFRSAKKNLNRIDPRLAEINGQSRISIYPELSSTFAELSPNEIKEIYRLCTTIARNNIETLLQLAYDSGKIEKSDFIKITNKVPTRSKIYTGPGLIPSKPQ